MIKRIFPLFLLVWTMFLQACGDGLTATPCDSDLSYSALATTWDEGVPLGNATLGELVWQKDSCLRLSLDRSDLWDLRTANEYDDPRFRYEWIKKMVGLRANDSIRQMEDEYTAHPGPSKIACAAVEFPLSLLGEVDSVHLFVRDALCRVQWKGGAELETFVHATEPVGWFVFRNVPDTAFVPRLIVPRYNLNAGADDLITSGHGMPANDLRKLGYEQGEMKHDGNSITFHQKGWGDFSYDVSVRWKRIDDELVGVWSVSSSLSDDEAAQESLEALERGCIRDFRAHCTYWDGFWAQSSVNVPDSVIQRQYDREMYKFGSASRSDSYPISLQAIWTADDGALPPWRGDFHNDLNTQLSYWPAYIGNHLDEGLAYLNTMWNQRDTYHRFADRFFGTRGIMIPGTMTLQGEPLVAGWAQYTLSPTTAAWMAQHFYLHWKYSADEEFLSQRGYPFMQEVAQALEDVTELRQDSLGRTFRTLFTSTSPEINDDRQEAWFPTITNFDLSLIRFVFGAAAEMAGVLGKTDEASHWSQLLAQMPAFDLDEDGALTFAHGAPYNVSHRHFSHAMAIMPLGQIDMSQGEESQHIIRSTLDKLDAYGPDWWCGYSYSWYACLRARAYDGEAAAKSLRTFAECFCLPNTFHANGDQTKSGKSNFIYRPFTLEGNFAFAAGLQEMLMQSHTGTVRLFPAIPSDWRDVSFSQLRAMGAFLVSAEMKDGRVTSVRVLSEKGGHLSILLPGEDTPREYDTTAGQTITIK